MAVITLDFNIRRGDSATFEAVIDGKHDDRLVYFTAKRDRELTTARLIDKSNQQPGELTTVYDGGNDETTVTIPIVPEDTQDLTVELIQIDIESVNALDSTDVETPANGTMSIEFDVRTEFDGCDLPSEPVTFQQIDASDFQVDSLMWVQDVDGVRTMVELTIDELKTELGI